MSESFRILMSVKFIFNYKIKLTEKTDNDMNEITISILVTNK